MSSRWVKALSASSIKANLMTTTLQFNHAIQSHTGRKKKNNEDYVTFYIPEKEPELKASGGLFVLADGVGGASYGEIASKYAADMVLFEYFQHADQDIGERLVQAFLKANQDIHQYAEESGRYTKMATTLVAAAIHDNRLILANVGDSRAYLLRGGKIKQLTRDHSVVAEMVRNGEMTEEEAQISSIRNRLSRSIGGQREVVVDLFPPIPLEVGDRILLCSDGLSRYATPENLLEMAGSGNPEEVARRLIKFSNQQGGADNISVALLEMVEKAAPVKVQPGVYTKPPKIEEWQTAETVFTPNPRRGRKKKFTVKEMLIGGALILGAAGLAVGLLIFPGNNPTPKPTATVESPSMSVIDEIATMTISLSTMMPDQQTKNLESQSAVEVQPRRECLYEVKPAEDKEYAEAIYNKFNNISLPEQLNFYDPDDCKTNEASETTCSKPQINNDIGKIRPGQKLILFPIENDELGQKCLDGGGIIHILKEE
jgi:protein phosphatase